MKTSHLLPPPRWVFSERISFEYSQKEKEMEMEKEKEKEKEKEL